MPLCYANRTKYVILQVFHSCPINIENIVFCKQFTHVISTVKKYFSANISLKLYQQRKYVMLQIFHSCHANSENIFCKYFTHSCQQRKYVILQMFHSCHVNSENMLFCKYFIMSCQQRIYVILQILHSNVIRMSTYHAV